jgi:hypothetical protein
LLYLFNINDIRNERILTTKVMFADRLELAKTQTKLRTMSLTKLFEFQPQ